MKAWPPAGLLCVNINRLTPLLKYQHANQYGGWASRESNTAPTGYEPAALTRHELEALAEVVRFELTEPRGPPVFKTGALSHSATLPLERVKGIEPSS